MSLVSMCIPRNPRRSHWSSRRYHNSHQFHNCREPPENGAMTPHPQISPGVIVLRYQSENRLSSSVHSEDAINSDFWIYILPSFRTYSLVLRTLNQPWKITRRFLQNGLYMHNPLFSTAITRSNLTRNFHLSQAYFFGHILQMQSSTFWQAPQASSIWYNKLQPCYQYISCLVSKCDLTLDALIIQHMNRHAVCSSAWPNMHNVLPSLIYACNFRSYWLLYSI